MTIPFVGFVYFMFLCGATTWTVTLIGTLIWCHFDFDLKALRQLIMQNWSFMTCSDYLLVLRNNQQTKTEMSIVGFYFIFKHPIQREHFNVLGWQNLPGNTGIHIL